MITSNTTSIVATNNSERICSSFSIPSDSKSNSLEFLLFSASSLSFCCSFFDFVKATFCDLSKVNNLIDCIVWSSSF